VAEGLLLTRPDDLDIGCHRRPGRERNVVERLEAPLVAQERLGFTNPKFQRRVTDTRVEVPDAELIEIATGDEALPPIPTL